MVTQNQYRLNYEVSVKQFSDIDLSQSFFDTFKDVYDPYFSEWANNKRNDLVFVFEPAKKVVAFMKLKVEMEDEDYSDISPVLPKKKRLKICSFKVESKYPGLSTQLMDIALSLALHLGVDEIYGTLAHKCRDKDRMEIFLVEKGFRKRGIKFSHNIEEDVFVKDFQTI